MTGLLLCDQLRTVMLAVDDMMCKCPASRRNNYWSGYPARGISELDRFGTDRISHTFSSQHVAVWPMAGVAVRRWIMEAFKDISGAALVLETLLSPCFGPDGISLTPHTQQCTLWLLDIHFLLKRVNCAGGRLCTRWVYRLCGQWAPTYCIS